MVVMKFGGASLRDGGALRQIAEIIVRNSFSRRVVVLSAVKGITDALIRATNESVRNESSILENAKSIQKRHEEIIENSIEDEGIRCDIRNNIQNLIERLIRLLKGAAFTGEVTPRNRDHIVSLGERMAIQLMSGCLRDMGLDALAFDSDEIGMVAQGDWGNGTVDLVRFRKSFPEFMAPVFKKLTIPVITGFFGEGKDGAPITFGRGGTDYSAAVIADALHAKRLEVWKDVDGFRSGNPTLVKNSHFLSNLSYDEAAELSYFGAKILHPRTVEPLLERNIPIVIRNTFDPEGVGSWIGPDGSATGKIVKSVTYDHNVAVLRVHGVDVGYTVGLLSTLVDRLSHVGINIRSVATSQTCINMLLDKASLREGYEYLQDIELTEVDSIETIENLALVAIVGEGLSHAEGLIAKAIVAMTQANIHVEMMVSGASKVAAYFIVREYQLENAVEVVHQTFFNSNEFHAETRQKGDEKK